MMDSVSFTQLPNIIWDRTDLNIYERVIFTHIVRKTIGWGKASDGISLSQFTSELDISKNTAIKNINSLINKGLITCDKSITKAGGYGFNVYEIAKTIVHLVNKGSSSGEQGLVHEVNKGSSSDEQGLVHEVNKACSSGEQGLVHEVNKACSSGEHTIETKTIKTNTKETNKNIISNSPAVVKKVVTRKTVIADNWFPSERCFELLEKAGINRAFALSKIDEFIFYWQERDEKRKGWDATFLGRVKVQFENSRRPAAVMANNHVSAVTHENINNLKDWVPPEMRN